MTGGIEPPPRQTDLLSDLNVDLQERQSAATQGAPALSATTQSATTQGATAGRLTDTARQDTTLPRVRPDLVGRAGTRPAGAGHRAAPALEIRVTPLHWCAPWAGWLSGGTGIEVRGGPVRFALTLLTR